MSGGDDWRIPDHVVEPSGGWAPDDLCLAREHHHSVAILQEAARAATLDPVASMHSTAPPAVRMESLAGKDFPSAGSSYPRNQPQYFQVPSAAPKPSAPMALSPMGAACGPKKRRVDEVDQHTVDDEPAEIMDCGSSSASGQKRDANQGKKAGMSVPEMIDQIAQKGEALSFDRNTNMYTVLNGNKFLDEFQALRVTRRKTSETAKDRPFARMPKFYQLVQGDRWSGTGSKFVPLAPSTGVQAIPIYPSGPVQTSSDPGVSRHNSDTGSPQSPFSSENTGPVQDIIEASRVHISLTDATGAQHQCSMQHFLDITGAGELYRRASGAPGSATNHSIFNFPSDQPISTSDINRVVGGLWTADSRGDQAYFFFRKEGEIPFRNGSIVFLKDGVLCTDKDATDSSGLFLVVSDNNAKWKGEPIPSKEEEPLGHWCAFLGQVPVVVKGAVRCGDHIGPFVDGTGFGQVVTPGESPAVGIALQNKEREAPGIVKTLVFAGLNALHGTGSVRAHYSSFLHDQVLVDQVTELMRDTEAIRSDVRDVQVSMDAVVGQNLTMQDRLGKLAETREEEEEGQEREEVVDVITAIPVSATGLVASHDAGVLGPDQSSEPSIESTEKRFSCEKFWIRHWRILVGALVLGFAAIIVLLSITFTSREGEKVYYTDGSLVCKDSADSRSEYSIAYDDLQISKVLDNGKWVNIAYAGLGSYHACMCKCQSVGMRMFCATEYSTLKSLWDAYGDHVIWLRNWIDDANHTGCSLIKGYDESGCIPFYSDLWCQYKTEDPFHEGNCICTTQIASGDPLDTDKDITEYKEGEWTKDDKDYGESWDKKTGGGRRAEVADCVTSSSTWKTEPGECGFKYGGPIFLR